MLGIVFLKRFQDASADEFPKSVDHETRTRWTVKLRETGSRSTVAPRPKTSDFL